MNPPASNRRGLTLIEVLAALAILSMVVTMGSAWVISLARGARDAVERSQRFGSSHRVLAVLRRDLDEADAGSVELDEGVITMTTTHRPGERVPQWQMVQWRYEPATGALMRSHAAVSDKEFVGQLVSDDIGDWSVQWDEPQRDTDLPPQLKISFRMDQKSHELLMAHWTGDPR